MVEVKKERSEVAENGGILAVALETAEKELADLRSAAADFVGRFRGEGLQAGSSIRSQLSALGGFIRGELRSAFRGGVRCCLAVASSHFTLTAESLDALSGGFFYDDDEETPEAQAAKRAELYALVEWSAGVLASHFEDEECPPYSPMEEDFEPFDEMTDAPAEDVAADPSASGAGAESRPGNPGGPDASFPGVGAAGSDAPPGN
jgi:hypothetical protein